MLNFVMNTCALMIILNLGGCLLYTSRPVKVFDVSQTDGKPLPELASSLSGNVPNYEAFMEALRRSAPVPITFEAMSADTDGYFSACLLYTSRCV